MTILEGLAVSVFSMSLVFLVLFFLFGLVIVFSRVLNCLASRRKADTSANNSINTGAEEAEDIKSGNISAGALQLINVDEKTAAIIMAIVSHESGIPLSELSFKSIKALDD